MGFMTSGIAFVLDHICCCAPAMERGVLGDTGFSSGKAGGCAERGQPSNYGSGSFFGQKLSREAGRMDLVWTEEEVYSRVPRVGLEEEGVGAIPLVWVDTSKKERVDAAALLSLKKRFSEVPPRGALKLMVSLKEKRKVSKTAKVLPGAHLNSLQDGSTVRGDRVVLCVRSHGSCCFFSLFAMRNPSIRRSMRCWVSMETLPVGQTQCCFL